MKKFVLGSLALAALLATPAMAADMPMKAPPPPPPVPIYDWSGLYGGVQAGFLWGSTDWLFDSLTSLSGVDGEHATIGGHVGAQIQFPIGPWGGFVFGVEFSASVPIEENDNNFLICPNPTFSCGLYKFDDIFTAGVRIGWAFDRFLLTASGGWASAEIHTRTFNILAPVPFVAFTSTERHHGWFFGVGAEFMVHKGSFVDFIVGVDYQHISLDEELHRDVLGVAGNPADPLCLGLGFCKTVDGEIDTIRFRLTIKTQGWAFLGFAPPPPAPLPVRARY